MVDLEERRFCLTASPFQPWHLWFQFSLRAYSSLCAKIMLHIHLLEVGIVGYSTWTAFGPGFEADSCNYSGAALVTISRFAAVMPGASELRDPFEEHED